MNKFILISLLLIGAQGVFGQHSKLVYLELGGSSIFSSVNFDSRFNKDVSHGPGFRAGVGGSFGAFDTDKIFTIPIGVNHIIGKGRNGLLLGVNSIFAIDTEQKSQRNPDFKSVIFSADIGYRFTPFNNGFSFQATYTPLFNTVDGTMPFWVGIGVGYTWK